MRLVARVLLNDLGGAPKNDVKSLRNGVQYCRHHQNSLGTFSADTSQPAHKSHCARCFCQVTSFSPGKYGSQDGVASECSFRHKCRVPSSQLMSERNLSIEWHQSYKADPHRTGFLDLPLEIRDYIYSFALRVEGAIFMYSPNLYSNRRPIYKARIVRHGNAGPIEPQRLGRCIALSMLQTCKQLHAECSLVFYGENIYRLGPLNDIDTSVVYRQLVRHVVYIADADLRIYQTNLDEVNYGWTRRLWPSIISGGTATLERYPNLETMTITLTSPRYVHHRPWRPAFFAVYNKTRAQRIAYAVRWLKPRCPLQNERLRDCLRVEMHTPPWEALSKEDFKNSWFADAVEEDDWDFAEFAEAFRVVKSLK